MKDLERIRQLLPRTELLAQLAEECSEMGHAALKLRRVYDGSNPTPVTEEEAIYNLLEEIADVELCLFVLEYNRPWHVGQVGMVIERKADRWLNRLEAALKKEE